jgi:ubiquitin carboxyl-terminal hydrolase 22/27/51
MCVYVKKHLEYRPYQRPSYIVKREEEKEKEMGMSQQNMKDVRPPIVT